MQAKKCTCPCFLFASRMDNVVPVANTLDFAQALDRQGIAFETHIYSYGPHRFSTANSSVQTPSTKMTARIPNWVNDSIGWLKEMLGDFSDNGMSAPTCRKFMNGNWEDVLNVDCTMGVLMSDPSAGEILSSLMAGFAPAAGEMGGGMDPQMLMKMAARMTLRDALGFVNAPSAAVEELDQKLRQIPAKK